MRAPAPYRAEQGYLDQEESKDQTLEPDRANANDNGSSTPPAPKGPAPYQPPTESVSAARPVTQAPTFSQMQAAGEARPPMPAQNGASWTDPATGEARNGATPPPGTPFYKSDVLVPNANGALTRTTSGDTANAFRGYVSPDGGGFGGFGSEYGDNATLMARIANGDKAAFAEGLNSADPRVKAAAQSYTMGRGSQGATADEFGAWQTAQAKQAADAKAASDLEQAQIAKSNADYEAARAANRGVPTRDMRAEGLAAEQAALGSGGGTYENGKFTPMVPTAQEIALERASLYRDMPNDIGAPATEGIIATPGKVQTTQTTPADAGTTPPASGGPANPSSVDVLGQLMKGASGQGAGSEVQTATQQAILDQLKNPNAYNSDAVKSAYNWMGGNIDDQFALQQKDLQEEMARRGLSTSTIGAGRLSDLNIGKRSAKETLAQDLGQKMAESQQSATGQAINQGLTGGTTAQNSQLDWLRNLIGYGQQGFENDMSTAKFNADQNNDWQQFLMQMLGQGYGTAGG